MANYAYISSTNPGSGTGATRTITRTFTAGAFGVLGIASKSENRTVVSVTDDRSQTWDFVDGVQSDNFRLTCYSCPNQIGGATTLTVTFDAATVTGVILNLDEYSNIKTAAPLDGTPHGTFTSSGSSITPTSITTANSGALIWSMAYSNNASRPLATPTGYTGRVSLSGGIFATADQRQAAAGSASVTWTVTGGNAEFACFFAAFDEASGGGGGGPVINDHNFRKVRGVASGAVRGLGYAPAGPFTLEAYRRERARAHREFMAKVRRAA